MNIERDGFDITGGVLHGEECRQLLARLVEIASQPLDGGAIPFRASPAIVVARDAFCVSEQSGVTASSAPRASGSSANTRQLLKPRATLTLASRRSALGAALRDSRSPSREVPA
jgi:hypothetical protein